MPRILAIETSCDETAGSVVDASGPLSAPLFKIQSNVVLSQLDLHAQWGGVVPQLAKREHEKTLARVIKEALIQSEATTEANSPEPKKLPDELRTILAREELLASEIEAILLPLPKPEIDLIAITEGPGLEPALWTGVNCARVLSKLWNLPLVPVNHMEGHFVTPMLADAKPLAYPALALLVSGGHTELVLSKTPGTYQIIGKTRDDASGEAFDKIARLLKLPYPGGPSLSKLALESTRTLESYDLYLPRPMIHSNDLDFSFSGLKTHIRYMLEKLAGDDSPLLTDETFRATLASEAQAAIVDVLIAKTIKAVEETEAKTVLIGGGVSANQSLRMRLGQALTEKFSQVRYIIPERHLSTDNAAMIGAAGYLRFLSGSGVREPQVSGTLRLGETEETA